MYPFAHIYEDQDQDSYDANARRIGDLWSYFIDQRGAPLLPACSEIEALLDWISRDIPDLVIKKAINQTLHEFRLTSLRPGMKLSRCKNEVNRLFKDHLNRSLLPEPDEPGDEPDIAALLKENFGKLTALIEHNVSHIPIPEKEQARVATTIITTLESKLFSEVEVSFDTVEKILIRVNRNLASKLFKAIPQDERVQLEQECTSLVEQIQVTSSTKRTQQIIKAMVQERIRTKYNLKSLSVINLLPE